jgi:peptidoglycan/LPS O-acetylase OafA/YrhL
LSALTSPQRGFHFDYLMPAELFPSALLGGLLLLWAAYRARSRQKLIGWSFGVAAGLLVAGQAFAVLSGLASGEAEPAGWLLPVAIAVIIVYILALLALAVGGILLLRDVLNRTSGT